MPRRSLAAYQEESEAYFVETISKAWKAWGGPQRAGVA